MTCLTKDHATRAVLGAPITLSAPFPPGGAERDEVFRCLQELVDGGLASWWINEAGGTELHFFDGKAFLLQHDGIVCLR
jgi:hypothetical protein